MSNDSKNDFTSKKPGVPSSTGSHRDSNASEIAEHLRNSKPAAFNSELSTNIPPSDPKDAGDTGKPTDEARAHGEGGSEQRRPGSKEAVRP